MTTTTDEPAAHARHADDHAATIRSAARLLRGHATATHVSLWRPCLTAAVGDLLDVAAGSDDLPTRWQALAVARALHPGQEASQ